MTRTRLFIAAALSGILSIVSTPADAAILPLGPERNDWSDLFLGGPTGGYTAGTLDFTATVTGAGDLELGGEFGPSNPGRHYGPNPNDAGGPFAARLSVDGVEVNGLGEVVDGGMVTVTFLGSAPGSIGDDYGLMPNDTLLEGVVTEVLLGATGAGTLDVLFEITGGALQDTNNAEGLPAFSPVDLGLMRFANLIPPVVDWSQDFSLDDSTLNTFGIPEPTSAVMLVVATALAAAGRARR